jgi:hypothetical protein
VKKRTFRVYKKMIGNRLFVILKNVGFTKKIGFIGAGLFFDRG